MTKYREEKNKWNFKFWRIVRFYRECGDVGGAEFVKSLYGDPSMMMIRFNSAKHSDKTPGLGFYVTVEAYRSGIHKELLSIYCIQGNIRLVCFCPFLLRCKLPNLRQGEWQWLKSSCDDPKWQNLYKILNNDFDFFLIIFPSIEWEHMGFF